MPNTLKLTAGEDIKTGQIVMAVTEDTDSKEPVTFVYELKPGYIPSGVALMGGKRWDQIEVAVSGQISSDRVHHEYDQTKATVGEKLYEGFVQIGKDGKLYNHSTVWSPIHRYVVAAADLLRGQRVVFSRDLKGYILATEGHKADGIVGKNAAQGRLFPMIVAFYNPAEDTFKPIDNVVINGD